MVCAQTAKTDWLQPFGFTSWGGRHGLLLFGLSQMSAFQRQERIWQRALDGARLLALVNLGLSPFLYWWNKLPFHPLFSMMAMILAFGALIFLSQLNLVLLRLSAMLPDETLRQEARQFTPLNRGLLLGVAGRRGSFSCNACRRTPCWPAKRFCGWIASVWSCLFCSCYSRWP